jgi:hypothetical protein
MVENLRIRLAGSQLLTDEEAQVAGERRIAVVNGLVLANEAAQFRGQSSCPRFHGRVFEDLVRFDRATRCKAAADDQQSGKEYPR